MHFWTQTLAPSNAWLAAKSQPVIKLHACARAWWRGLFWSTSEPRGQRCHLGDSPKLPRGASSLLSSSYSSFFLFPTACNWKCIYCRARGWTGEREALQLMKMWLRWGPQGLAPLQHHQLTHTVNFFFSLSLFRAALFVYCSLTYFSPLCLLVFSFSIMPFIFALLPLLSFVSFYPVLDWACMRSISNANGAAWIDTSFVLPVAICSKERWVFFRFKSHSVLLLSVCEVFPYWNTQTPIKMRVRWLGRNWNLFHIMHCFIVDMRISRFNFCLFVLLILPD